MRKVHRKIVLDVYTVEDEDFADENTGSNFESWLGHLGELPDSVDVIDVTVEYCGVRDSR